MTWSRTLAVRSWYEHLCLSFEFVQVKWPEGPGPSCCRLQEISRIYKQNSRLEWAPQKDTETYLTSYCSSDKSVEPFM